MAHQRGLRRGISRRQVEFEFELELEFEFRFELLFELELELLFELELELLFELELLELFELELLDEFDELLLRNASWTAVSVTAGIGKGASRVGSAGAACAAPAAKTPAAMMVTVYFMITPLGLRARRSGPFTPAGSGHEAAGNRSFTAAYRRPRDASNALPGPASL